MYLPPALPIDSAYAAQANKPLQLAPRLLPWLVAGTVSVILAQILKADLEKGWAAWLQAFVTVGIGFGAFVLTLWYIDECMDDSEDQVLPTPCKHTCVHMRGCVCGYVYVPGGSLCLAPAATISMGRSEC